MQVNTSSGREQKVLVLEGSGSWFKPNLLSQGQAWAPSNVARSIILLPLSSSRGRSSAKMKENTPLGFSTLPNSLQLQCHSAGLCWETSSLGINFDLSNWEILHYNPPKWQLSCFEDCTSLVPLPLSPGAAGSLLT